MQNGKRFEGSPEAALHAARSLGHTADQPGATREAKDDSIGLSEVVTAQDDRFGRNDVHGDVRLPERNEVENPPEQESDDNEFGEDLQAIHEPLPVIAL